MKESEFIETPISYTNLCKSVVINIFLSHSKIKDELLCQLKPFDLSLEQFNVLRILRGQKGNPINLQDIQERMISKMSNTTRLVDKLISKKFVKRNICKENRRKVEIAITNLGLKILQNIDPLIETTENELAQKLSIQELEQLNTLLIKLKN